MNEAFTLAKMGSRYHYKRVEKLCLWTHLSKSLSFFFYRPSELMSTFLFNANFFYLWLVALYFFSFLLTHLLWNNRLLSQNHLKERGPMGQMHTLDFLQQSSLGNGSNLVRWPGRGNIQPLNKYTIKIAHCYYRVTGL